MRLYVLLFATATIVTVVTAQQCPCQKGEKGDIGPRGRRGPKGEKGESLQEIDLDEIQNIMTAANENIAALTERTEELERENADLQDLITRVNSNAARLEAFLARDNIRVALCRAGLKDGRIPDSDISASSSWADRSWNHGPQNARLDRQVQGNGGWGSTGAWSAASSNLYTNAWIQVDFRSPTDLTGIVTQGRARGAAGRIFQHVSQWVTSFEIGYSDDGQTWTTINKRFQGNDDWNSYVVNMFPETVRARYVRLYTLSCYGHCSVRMEYLTC